MTTKQVRLRRGTTQEHENFIGVQGEVTVDVDKKTLRVHDNSTPGGILIATEQFVEESLVGVTQGPQGEQGPPGTTDYNDLTNKPDFATVATTGSFYDLQDIPDEIERLVWVGLNGDDTLNYEGRGNALLPFRTIQAAVDYLMTENGGAILVAPGQYVGDININTEKAIIVYGFDASHTKNTIIKGTVTVTNGSSNFSVKNVDISPNGNRTAVDLQIFGIVSFENAVIEAPQATSGTDLIKIDGSAGLAVQFENCTIIENNTAGVNITNSNPLLSVTFDNMQGNPTINAAGACRVLYTGSSGVGNINASGTGNVQISSVAQCGTITHTNGSIVISNIAFLQGVTSTVNSGLGYSFNLSNVNFLRTDGTYSPLVKSGTCPYTITNTNYNIATATINGQRRSYGTLTGDIGRTVKLVTTETHLCSGSDEEILVNYAGEAVITLPTTAVNGMRIKVRDISNNLGKIAPLHSAQYGMDRAGLTITVKVADTSGHTITGNRTSMSSVKVRAPGTGVALLFFNNTWYMENLSGLEEDTWWSTRVAGVNLNFGNLPGGTLGGAGFIPESKGHSSWDLELGAYSSDHIDRSYYHPDDTYGTPEAWSRIWLSNRGAIIGNNPYGGASLTLDGGTLNLRSPMDIVTPNGIKASNVSIAPSNIWEYSRLTIDSGLSYSNTTSLDFTNSRGGTRWVAVGGKRDGGQYTFNPSTTGTWKSDDGINFSIVPNSLDEPGYGQAEFVHVAHSSAGGIWGTLMSITQSKRLFKSIDGGNSWSEVATTGITINDYSTPRLIGAGDRFYLIGARDILQSTDMGTSWTSVVPTAVTLDENIVLNAVAYNKETNTIIVVGGKWEPSSFGWKGSYAIRSQLDTTDHTQWTELINTTSGGIIGIATVTDYDGVDRWALIREKSWNPAIHDWGTAPQFWNEGNTYVTVQFNKRLATVLQSTNNDVGNPAYGQLDLRYNQPTTVTEVWGGVTGQSTLSWEDPNFYNKIMARTVMTMDRTGTPIVFVAMSDWMGGTNEGENNGFIVSKIFTVPDKRTINPHEDLTESIAAGQIKALAVLQSGPNMMVVADGDFPTYGVGRMVTTDGRNWQTWYSLSGVYTESDPQYEEHWIDVQRAPVNDIIAITPSQNTESTIGRLYADPANSSFRIQGKQLGSAVMIDTRDANGVLSYNLACYDNKVYAKNLVVDGAVTSMNNIINLDNMTYANQGLAFKGNMGMFHNPYPDGFVTVPTGQVVVLASYNEQFTSAKFIVNAQSDDGVHGQTSEIIVTGLVNNINNPNGSVTSVTNTGGSAWLAFGIQRNPDNIQQIQIVCATSYACKVSVLPTMLISPNL